MSFDAAPFDGDRVAAVVGAVHRWTHGQVTLRQLCSEPASLTLVGPMPELERLCTTTSRDELCAVTGGGVVSLQLDPGGSTGSREPPPGFCVLLVDDDLHRAARNAEILGRAQLQACIVSTIKAARDLLLRTELTFDALVLRHRLGDGEGLAVLEGASPDERGCSVLVLDDQRLPERARAYRTHGAFRYIVAPSTDLQLIGHVHATVLDSQSWRRAAEPRGIRAGMPPRLFLDPAHGADRLQYVSRLTKVEREVAYWVLLGLRDADIAKRLKRSERTAKRHVGQVLEKTGVQNRSSLWAALYHDGRDGSPPLARSPHVEGLAADAGIVDPERRPTTTTTPAANQPPPVAPLPAVGRVPSPPEALGGGSMGAAH